MYEKNGNNVIPNGIKVQLSDNTFTPFNEKDNETLPLNVIVAAGGYSTTGSIISPEIQKELNGGRKKYE